MREDGVSGVDDPVSIAAVLRLVKLGQGAISIAAATRTLRARRLFGEVAEQFLAIVNFAVMVAVQRQEGVTRVTARPRQFDWVSCSGDVEHYAVLRRREVEAVTRR